MIIRIVVDMNVKLHKCTDWHQDRRIRALKKAMLLRPLISISLNLLAAPNLSQNNIKEFLFQDDSAPFVGSETSRRSVISSIFMSTAMISMTERSVASDMVGGSDISSKRGSVTLHLTSPPKRLGLELSPVTIGTPPRIVLAVKSVGGIASGTRIQPGMILRDFSSSDSLIDRLKNGPYPLDLQFYNLAGGGDAFGDTQETIVTPKDALELAESNSRNMVTPTRDNTVEGLNRSYNIQILKKPDSPSCERIKSRRGDVMEIQYEAAFRTVSADGQTKTVVYDSSAQRGTGLPYQFVLGSGDMIAGVDQGLYDMCPGEERQLEIPKELGYGNRGNKLFRIPGGVNLLWKVQLVAVNSVKEGDDRTREDIEGRQW